MDNYDKIAGVYGEGAEAAAGTGMAGQPWRVGVVKSVDPYQVEIAGGIVFEKEKLYINWLFRLRDWEAEAIDLPNHPYVAFTETAGKIRWKQSALLEVGDQVVLLLVDDQTAYLIAKVVPA